MFDIFWATVITVGSISVVDVVHASRPFCEAWNNQIRQSETWKIVNSTIISTKIECFPTTEPTTEGASNQIKMLKTLKVINGSSQNSI